MRDQTFVVPFMAFGNRYRNDPGYEGTDVVIPSNAYVSSKEPFSEIRVHFLGKYPRRLSDAQSLPADMIQNAYIAADSYHRTEDA